MSDSIKNWKSRLIQDVPDKSGKRQLYYTFEHSPCNRAILMPSWEPHSWPWCFKCGNMVPTKLYREIRKKQLALNQAMEISNGYTVF